MSLNRREFIQLMGLAAAAGLLPGCESKQNQASKGAGTGSLASNGVLRKPEDLYNIPKFGNAAIMHMTDCHAQLHPIYFREPNVNLGVGSAYGNPPHLVGHAMLKHFGIAPNSIEAHAFTYLDYVEACKTYGKVGGFSHLRTLIKKLRAEHGANQTLLIDGGDTWQGSATSYWTRGKDMVGATNLLGVDAMTGHWEFTYTEEEVINNVKAFKGDFLVQNCFVKADASFDYKYADFAGYNDNSLRAFKPYSIKQMGGVRIAVIGQGFPYTPIANPQRFIPDWTFGIRDSEMQNLVNQVRAKEKPDAVIVVSHNGMDVDLKMASVVTGIDAIFGGHTHDAVPAPTVVKNKSGQTLVTNAGSNGKFLGFMQLDIRNGKVQDFRYRLLPIFSNLLEADKEMEAYIAEVRKPYVETLGEKLAITMDNVMDQTCITYPETYARDIKGSDLKMILEDVADNLFNKDPYYQQGGDMVRVGGMDYSIDINAKIGHRISDMRLDDGTPIEPSKTYKVSGWATVGSQSPGEPIWETVSTYLRHIKVAKFKKLNTPKIIGAKGNPGIADYDGVITS
ncbi:MAG: 5'-nucleotidase C-terminal domain-containing protein [Gammaproteobacteria bacterium]